MQILVCLQKCVPQKIAKHRIDTCVSKLYYSTESSQQCFLNLTRQPLNCFYTSTFLLFMVHLSRQSTGWYMYKHYANRLKTELYKSWKFSLFFAWVGAVLLCSIKRNDSMNIFRSKIDMLFMGRIMTKQCEMMLSFHGSTSLSLAFSPEHLDLYGQEL